MNGLFYMFESGGLKWYVTRCARILLSDVGLENGVRCDENSALRRHKRRPLSLR